MRVLQIQKQEDDDLDEVLDEAMLDRQLHTDEILAAIGGDRVIESGNKVQPVLWGAPVGCCGWTPPGPPGPPKKLECKWEEATGGPAFENIDDPGNWHNCAHHAVCTKPPKG